MIGEPKPTAAEIVGESRSPGFERTGGRGALVLDPELVHTDLRRVPVRPQQGCDHLTQAEPGVGTGGGLQLVVPPQTPGRGRAAPHVDPPAECCKVVAHPER